MEDRTEISQEELQSWIRDEVHKARLTSPGILKKYSLLQSLLERKQRQATRFLELCQSVVVFENTVKELYSQLGWEYTDLDSDSDDGVESTSCRDCIHMPSASRVSAPQSPTSDYKEDQEEIISQNSPVVALKQEAVVVLTKLTRSQIASAKRPPSPDADNAESEDLSSAESDNWWEPDEEMTESDCSDSDFSTGSNKKRKFDKHGGNSEKLNRASKKSRRESSAKTSKAKASASTASKNGNEGSVTEMSSLPATSDSDPESSQQDATTPPTNCTKTASWPSSKTNKTSEIISARNKVKTTSQAKTTTQSSTTSPATVTPATSPASNRVGAESDVVKTFTPSANTKVVTPASLQSSKSTTAPPSVPKGEIKLNMNVLARKNPLCWQQGKVAEIIRKEDGKVKYKITFEEKGKSLVSSHHVAFDRMPKLEELSIGCRVVVKSSGGKADFLPGIMAELPSRKNRMRFLVYIDDHTPVYAGLPVLRLVYRPLADPLDDILNDNHRDFMREYLRLWPYPPQTQYKVGQILKAEYEGTMQTCEVITVDCSLVEVIFKSNQHKEWLYRGSLRLEHMVNMKYYMSKKEEGEKELKRLSTSVTGSIKLKH